MEDKRMVEIINNLVWCWLLLFTAAGRVARVYYV